MAESTTRERPRRSAGEGAIYTTKDGRLRGAVTLPHPDGTRSVRRYVTGRTRAELVRKIEALRKESACGFATGETTSAYLARWIVAVRPRLRPATHVEYARHVRAYWTPTLGGVVLTRLTSADVERAMAALIDRGLSPQTVRHARSPSGGPSTTRSATGS